jgi:hypothetical protein
MPSSLRFPALPALLAMLLAGCLDPIQPETLTGPAPGTVVGQVTDFCQGLIMRQVDVLARRVGGADTGQTRVDSSDAAGAFQFRGLEPGTWALSLARAGYQTGDKTVEVISGRTQQVDLVLTPVPSSYPTSAKLDVLFVVDNSESMSEEQKALAEAFPSFLDTLRRYGFLLDLRVGVISTDLGAGQSSVLACHPGGDGGKLQSQPRRAGCQGPTDPFISMHGDETNVPGGKVNEAFACIVQLGVNGCGFEQPLEAVLRCLDDCGDRRFPRTDSVLAVVVISDEDDCSAVLPSLFDSSQKSLTDPLGPLTSFRCFEFGVKCHCASGNICGRTLTGPRTNCQPGGSYLRDVDEFVRHLTAGRGKGKVYFAVIAGPDDSVVVSTAAGDPTLKPSCKKPTGLAYPAIRLKAVVSKLKPSSDFTSICTDTLRTPMAHLAKQIAETALLNPCD